MWVEQTIKAVAARQYGLLRRSQLISQGVTDNDICRYRQKGRIRALHPGVFYLESATPTWRTDVLAGVLAAGPDTLASHRCAAVLWGFDAVLGRTIEVTVPYVESPEPVGVLVHRTRRPNPSVAFERIPITSPEKTLLDIAPMVPQRVLEKATRSAVHAGQATPEGLDLTVGTYGGRGVAGTRAMRRVIQLVTDDLSGSVSEIDLKHIVLEAPVPSPVQQLRIGLLDRSNAYPDFAWPDRMRIVEVDGFGAHGTPEQLQHDLRRQNQLLDLGWEIRRFTATEIREEPQRVRSEIVRFVNKPFRESQLPRPGSKPSQNG